MNNAAGADVDFATKDGETRRHREQTDGSEREAGLGGLGEKGDRIEEYRLAVTE